MWSTYMKTFDEYDKRISNSWKEDATGLLVFVSHSLHTPRVHRNDRSGIDRSILRSRWCFYHRKLQKVVCRFRGSDGSPSWPDLTAAWRFHERYLPSSASEPTIQSSQHRDRRSQCDVVDEPCAQHLIRPLCYVTATVGAQIHRNAPNSDLGEPARARSLVLVPRYPGVSYVLCNPDSSRTPSPLSLPVFRRHCRILFYDSQGGGYCRLRLSRSLCRDVRHSHRSSLLWRQVPVSHPYVRHMLVSVACLSRRRSNLPSKDPEEHSHLLGPR
jgi:hypothetical protein